MEHLNLFWLQHARKKRKFTVKFVSRIIGITASTLCHWETGKTPIPAEKLLQLCHLYGNYYGTPKQKVLDRLLAY